MSATWETKRAQLTLFIREILIAKHLCLGTLGLTFLGLDFLMKEEMTEREV